MEIKEMRRAGAVCGNVPISAIESAITNASILREYDKALVTKILANVYFEMSLYYVNNKPPYLQTAADEEQLDAYERLLHAIHRYTFGVSYEEDGALFDAAYGNAESVNDIANEIIDPDFFDVKFQNR